MENCSKKNLKLCRVKCKILHLVRNHKLQSHLGQNKSWNIKGGTKSFPYFKPNEISPGKNTFNFEKNSLK